MNIVCLVFFEIKNNLLCCRLSGLVFGNNKNDMCFINCVDVVCEHNQKAMWCIVFVLHYVC